MGRCMHKQPERSVLGLSESSRDSKIESGSILEIWIHFRSSNLRALAKPKSRYFRLFVYMRLIFLLLPLFLFAADEIREEVDRDVNVLSVGERVEGDYFAFDKVVEISGVVAGDVYVMGGQVFIDGEVLGSVLVAGGTCEISGRVGESVRILGGQVRISGRVGSS